MDAGLHQLQGKAEYVSDASLLAELHRDKLTLLARHQTGAQSVTQYDANNAYQYVINRDEAHLSWIADAIGEAGGAVPSFDAAAAEGTRPREAQATIADDARQAQEFVTRWQPRVHEFTDARYQGLLRVVLGEMLEEKRFFDQAQAGRRDLLGKRSPAAAPAIGDVLPIRWIE